MSRIYDDTRGRPTTTATRNRRREFLRLLAAGETEAKACELSGMSRHAFVTNLQADEFFAVYAAIRSGRSGPVAVTVAPNSEKLAA